MLQDVVREKGGIDLLPAGQELSGLELTVAGINAARPLILKRFIEKSALKEYYDFIIIDGPPTLGLLVVNILCAADGVLVPFRPDNFSKKGLSHFYDVLDDIEDAGIAQIPDVLAHIPNLVENRRKQDQSDLEDITKDLKDLGDNIYISEPFLNRSLIGKAQGRKKSIFDYSSKDYYHLQQQFLRIADLIEEWRDDRQN